MTPDEVRQIVEQTIQGNSLPWWSYLGFLIASGVGAYLGAYLKQKAQDKAIKENHDILLEQLRKQTETTEKTKSEISQASEIKSILREKRDELVVCAFELKRLIFEGSQMQNKIMQATEILILNEINPYTDRAITSKIQALVNLNFPKCESEKNKLIQIFEEKIDILDNVNIRTKFFNKRYLKKEISQEDYLHSTPSTKVKGMENDPEFKKALSNFIEKIKFEYQSITTCTKINLINDYEGVPHE